MVDVITHTNFGVYKLRGYGYTGGGRILAFPTKMEIDTPPAQRPVFNSWF